MNYRLSERIMLSACAAGILIVMLGNRRQSLTMSAVGAGLGVLALGLLQMVLFYKCPHCGARLEPRGPVPKFCPNCGKELD